MSGARRPWLVGFAFLIVLIASRLLRLEWIAGFLAILFTSVLLLARLPRWVALAMAAASAALVTMFVLHVHEELRGERPDEGPIKVAARAPDSLDLPDTAHFLVWGDCRSGVTVLEKLCDAITERRPSFSVGLGDLVGMARTYQFRILCNRLEGTGVPAFVVPGNHDVDPFGSLRPYERVFGPTHWSFYDPTHRAHFIGIDSARGIIAPEEAQWLEEIIGARRSAPHTLLFLHHPLYPPAGHPEKPLPEDDATRRVRALAQKEGMHVFASHYHGYDVQTQGRVTQVTTGGAGARPESDAPYHYVWVTIDASGVKAEQVVLAQQSEVSEFTDRLLTFRDEALYTPALYPILSGLVFLGAALFLGGAVSSALPRRHASDHSSNAKSV